MFSSAIALRGLDSVLTYASNPALQNKNIKELENEILAENIIKTSNEKGFQSYLGDRAVRVLFEDGKSQRLVSMRLSEANFVRLKEHFNESDFYQRADGNIRLNGRVQNLVSGWFANAAYDLNMLEADTNKDGIVADKELENSFVYEYPYFQANAKRASDITELRAYGGGKIAFNESSARMYIKNANIQAAANLFLELDENLNGKISFKEFFGGENIALAKAENYVNSQASNLKELEKLKIKAEFDNNYKESKNDKKDVKQKALEQGLQALTSNELNELKAKDPLSFERLSKNTELKNLQKDFQQELIKALQENKLSLLDIKA